VITLIPAHLADLVESVKCLVALRLLQRQQLLLNARTRFCTYLGEAAAELDREIARRCPASVLQDLLTDCDDQRRRGKPLTANLAKLWRCGLLTAARLTTDGHGSCGCCAFRRQEAQPPCSAAAAEMEPDDCSGESAGRAGQAGIQLIGGLVNRCSTGDAIPTSRGRSPRPAQQP
jgi:hypothetical protein